MIRLLASAALAAVGAAAVHGDLRYRRISNRWILAGLVAAAAGYCLLAVRAAAASWGSSVGELLLPRFTGGFFAAAALHLGVTCLATVALWRLRVWPAGDAKLFAVMALLVPLIDPVLPGFPGALAIWMLVNTFVPAGLFVLAKVGWDAAAWGGGCLGSPGELRRRVQAAASKTAVRLVQEWGRREAWLTLGASLLALLVFIQPLLQLAAPDGGVASRLALFFGMYVVWDRLGAFLRRRTTALAAVLAAGGLLLPMGVWWGWDITGRCLEGLRLLFGFTLFLMVGRTLLVRYLEKAGACAVEPGDLRAGMILTREGWSAVEAAGVAGLPRYADGLSQEEVAEIQSQAAARGRSLRLEIHRASPFAPWLVAGTLWTLACDRNAAEWLVRALTRHG